MRKPGIIVLIFLFACTNSNQDSNSISLFNEFYFKLQGSEKVSTVTGTAKNNYLRIMENNPFQAPLFKYVKTSDYNLYIGIPLNTTIKEIALGKEPFQTDKYYSQTDTANYYYSVQQIDSAYTATYIGNFQNNLISIVAESKSLTLVDSLFNVDQISQRIKSK